MLVSRIWKIDGKRPLELTPIAGTAQEAGWPMDWYGMANAVTCPRGHQYGEAHFVVSQATLDALTLTSPMAISCQHEDGTATWAAFYCIRTQSITQSPDESAHWITLADRRWFFGRASACNKRYNLRNSTTGYIASTTNGGTPYTWAEILSDLWAELPTPGGAPSLPITPSSTPENLIFEGMNAWRAINQVLTSIGCGVCYDPFSDSFSYVDLKATQAGLSSLIDDNKNRRLWEYSPQELLKSNYPDKVIVTFPKIPDGTDAPFAPPVETEEVALGQGSFAGTNWPILETMFWFDDNSSARTTRASEIKDALIGLLKPMARPWGAIYSGIVPFTIGSDLTEITWSSDGTRGTRTIAKFSRQEIDWPILTLAGSSDAIIEFTVDSATTVSNTSSPFDGMRKLTVTIISPSCSFTSLHGDTVDVYEHDPQCLTLGELDAELVGRKGWAYQGVYQDQSSGASPGDLTPCHFVLMGICCP